MPLQGPFPAAPLRRAMIGQVRAVFHDQARGERPVARSRDALFEPGSPIWRVHGDVVAMMVGGIAALLLQMLHPAALAGVWDHSNFRQDMLGRLRRTARFIAVTTYAERREAEAAIARVNRIHRHVAGVLPDGTPYSAQDSHLLAWVHVTEATCFLRAWQRYGPAPLTPGAQDRYFQDFARIARALGADPVPVERAGARRLIDAMRPQLKVDARTVEVARLIIRQDSPNLVLAATQRLLTHAAIGILPDWAAAMHGLRTPRLARPAIGPGTAGMARALRWAFRGA